ncbi:hypothetical protein GQ600_16018 [Phytophthora cactorum]|nr:hypothetical protein GQ600_16018 [Phytophthora cactorum]
MLNRFYDCRSTAGPLCSSIRGGSGRMNLDAGLQQMFVTVTRPDVSHGGGGGVAMNYVAEYNNALTDFGFDLLLDDEWVAQMLNEAQVAAVVSWSDSTTGSFF